MTVHGQVAGDQAVADRQNLDVLRAIFTALDEAGGRSWRTLHPDAPTAILGLAEDAERRGAVKALRGAPNYVALPAPAALALRDLANRIEAGEMPI